MRICWLGLHLESGKSDMVQDHQMTFDWIFFAIVAPWPLLAVWELFRGRNEGLDR